MEACWAPLLPASFTQLPISPSLLDEADTGHLGVA